MRLTLPVERAKQIKVWILVPAAGDLIHATFSNCIIGLQETLRQHGINSRVVYLPGDSLVTRARNNLAYMFMANSTDSENHYSLWLDCDVLFDPQSVLEMLALNLDFVAAPYSKKGIHLDRIAEAARLNWPNDRMMAASGTPNVNWLTNNAKLDEPMPVLEAGTGFWLLKRKVFEQMQVALGEDTFHVNKDGKTYFTIGIKYIRSHEEHAHYGKDGYAFFQDGIDPETREFLSEDWWFCRAWRRLGGTVYCCFWVKTNHIGPHLYPLDMPAIAELLKATGGSVLGPTKEKYAETQVRSGAVIDREHGNGSSGSFAPDILRAIAGIGSGTASAPHETASASDTSPLGG